MRIKNLLILFIVTLVIQQNLTAQIIWEDNRSMIYPFLDRMADKGIIELNDVVQPISHQQIISCLDSLRKSALVKSAAGAGDVISKVLAGEMSNSMGIIPAAKSLATS